MACKSSHRIEDLKGVPPCPIRDLPSKCLCGQVLTYADPVTFHPAPPLEGGETMFGVYTGQVLTVNSAMTRNDLAKILRRN